MLYLIKSPSHDPYLNLALEQLLFDKLDKGSRYLMLWQNENTIVVGKYQNTYREINPQFVEEQGIRVVRRLSGGGAVYHDLGNLNYTFIDDAGDVAEIRFDLFCRPVVALLQSLGVPAQLQGRNDMTVDGKKFSGSAQYVKSGRVMHHGTLLFDSDLTVLSRALQVSADKIESKGIASVRSRVCNLKEYLPAGYSLADFERDLFSAFARDEDVSEYTFTAEDMEKARQLKAGLYETWDWNYGRSPQCSMEKSRRLEGVGSVQVSLDLKNGCIENIHFSGDFFAPEEPEALSALLKGCPFHREGLKQALGGKSPAAWFRGLDFDAFAALILE